METIVLSQFEQKICYIIAKERLMVDEKSNVTERKVSTDSAIDIGYRGVVGEFVVAKYLNVYPDFTTEPRSGGHELTYHGWGIDAKYCHPHKNLIAPLHKKIGSADIYICVNGVNPYYILGWCFEAELIDNKNIAEWMPKPCYFLGYEYLRQPLDLYKIIWK